MAGKKYLLTGNRPLTSGGYPEYGSVVSKCAPRPVTFQPTFIDESFVGPGYLGNEFSVNRRQADLGIPYSVRGICLRTASLSIDTNPKGCLMIWTRFRGLRKTRCCGQGLDRFGAQAHDIIVPPPPVRPLIWNRKNPRNPSDSANMNLARACCSPRASLRRRALVTIRLRPAGVDFDTHTDNFSRLRKLLPPFDKGLAGLFDRLEERGSLNPPPSWWPANWAHPQINGQGGRDRWAGHVCPDGGDIRGQVGGETDAEQLDKNESVSPEDLAASFFRNIGIDLQMEFQANVGRPITLVRDGNPIGRLF